MQTIIDQVLADKPAPKPKTRRGPRPSKLTTLVRNIIDEIMDKTGESPSTNEILKRLPDNYPKTSVANARREYLTKIVTEAVAHTKAKEWLLRTFMKRNGFVFWPSTGIEFHAEGKGNDRTLSDVYADVFPNMDNTRLLYSVHGDHRATLASVLKTGQTFDLVDFDPFGCTPWFYTEAHRLLHSGSMLCLTHLNYMRSGPYRARCKRDYGITIQQATGKGLIEYVSQSLSERFSEVLYDTVTIGKCMCSRTLFYVK